MPHLEPRKDKKRKDKKNKGAQAPQRKPKSTPDKQRNRGNR